jgi:putative ABC transport system permease protein
MKRTELIRFAAGAIFAHPMRSALTALGVVIGVGAVVCMTSIGLGVQKQVSDRIGALGSNLITIQPGQARGGATIARQGAGSAISINDEDTDAIRMNISNVAAVSAAVRGQSQVVGGGQNTFTTIWGVDPDYITIRDMSVAKGRMFSDDDARQGRKVVVIGQSTATTLFADQDPVGQRLRVGQVPFEIIGVFTPKGQSATGQDQDDMVMGPLKAVRTRVLGRRIKGSAVQNIFVKAADKDQMTQVQSDITDLLRDRHKIPSPDLDDFQVQNMAQIMETAQATTKTFTFLLGGVAGVSLLVGGVGIMNIMLVAVTERTREIGLRMALGATRGDVLFQFALEAVTLSLFGGILGLLFGLLGGYLMSKIGGFPVAIAPWAPPLALGFSMFVGLVFGAYPSWRAAQLDPIEALRRD